MVHAMVCMIICKSAPGELPGICHSQRKPKRPSGGPGRFVWGASVRADSLSLPEELRTPHAVAAIVAQITVAIADRNRAAVVARGSVGLELCELQAPHVRAV